jgi:hypothetical protein
MRYWRCSKCGKTGTTRFFGPSWASMGAFMIPGQYRLWHWIREPKVIDHIDYGGHKQCGVVEEGRPDFEGV